MEIRTNNRGNLLILLKIHDPGEKLCRFTLNKVEQMIIFNLITSIILIINLIT